MAEDNSALHHLSAAGQHLNEAAKVLMTPTTKSTVADEGVRVARSAELLQDRPPLWASITQAAGGYWVSVSHNAIETPFGAQVPDAPGQKSACADLDEVFAVLRRRFE